MRNEKWLHSTLWHFPTFPIFRFKWPRHEANLTVLFVNLNLKEYTLLTKKLILKQCQKFPILIAVKLNKVTLVSDLIIIQGFLCCLIYFFTFYMSVIQIFTFMHNQHIDLLEDIASFCTRLSLRVMKFSPPLFSKFSIFFVLSLIT